MQKEDATLYLTCDCGEAQPTREHFMWHCPLTETERGMITLEPNAKAWERKLGVLVVPKPASGAVHSAGVDTDIVHAMKRIAEANNGAVHVATDGGAQGKKHLTVATWGMALAEPIPKMLPDIPEGETAEAAENSYTDIYGNRRPQGLQTSTDYQARRRIKERREENAKRKRGIDEQPDHGD